jgi:hypothetical protein
MGNTSKLKIKEYRVEICDTLLRELTNRFGEENVKLAGK